MQAFLKWSAPAEPEVDPLVEALHDSLTEAQRLEICLPWDHADEQRGTVRNFIANHWQVTRPCVRSDFFTDEQKARIFEIVQYLLDVRWRRRFMRSLSDDTKGHPWGQDQSIAFIGTPGKGPWQFLFTGRHLTLRAQGAGSSAFAFGAPIVYGHAAKGRYWEKSGHRGNIFWPQAAAANRIHRLLDGPTRALAEVDRLPDECDIHFRDRPQGAPVASFFDKPRRAFEALLSLLLEPYRARDRDDVRTCIAAQGGIDRLHLAFARTPRISTPLWDVWRIEGPAFVWHFQGFPHVHGWVHVASTPEAGAVTARHGAFLFPGQDELR